MNSIRDDVKDVFVKYINENLSFCDATDTASDLADICFESLGITEKEQDIEGAKVCVNPKIVITVRGGLAEACEYHPKNMDISIRDYDTEGSSEEDLDKMNIGKDDFGEVYIERF